MNNPEIKQFIRENSYLFWWIREDAKAEISLNLLIETILNYGDIESIKNLFTLIGIKKVAEIFYQSIHRKRVNYHPRTINFFTLYFTRNA
ncbi:hypothetical protein D4R71_02160 [bacterium]|nr:hypothetical protein [Candidatus Celaenobacter polaris]TSA27433.1 MAG: hypothetical protein D4R71_02160 [bacterium]